MSEKIRKAYRLTPEKPHKYRAKRTDGYASAKEAKRAAELKLLQANGKIAQLIEQPSYTLLPSAPELGYRRPLRYVADFRYIIPGKGVQVEDCKGFRTPVYRLKKRLMEQMIGIKITEV